MEKRILICTNRRLTEHSPSCGGAGAEQLVDELERLLAERGLQVNIERAPCLGRCAEGPNLRFIPGGEFYHQLTPERLPEVLGRLEAFIAGL